MVPGQMHGIGVSTIVIPIKRKGKGATYAHGKGDRD